MSETGREVAYRFWLATILEGSCEVATAFLKPPPSFCLKSISRETKLET